MSLYISFISLLIFLSIFHLGIIYKSYIPYLSSWIDHGEIEFWNKKTDPKKIILAAMFYLAPLYMFKGLREINIQNDLDNYFLLFTIIGLSILGLYLNKVFILDINFLNKNNSHPINILGDTEKIEITLEKKLKPEIKPGPNSNGLKYIVTKYYLIQHFYKEFEIDSPKFRYKKDFLEFISKNENIKKIDSLKSPYKIIREMNFDEVLRWNEKEINLLLENNEFDNFPLIKKYFKSNKL